MWELIIAYMVGDNLEKFTRRSTGTSEHSWEYTGDGFWTFHHEEDGWSGIFSGIVWCTETKVGEEGDGAEGEAESEGEDDIAVTGQVPPIVPWATGRDTRREGGRA